MLNAILNKLNGHAIAPDALEEALTQLGKDREATRTDIDSINQRRRQALLDDASDSEIDKLDRLVDRATIRLEKLNISEQPLRERLTAAQGEARKKTLARERAAFRAEFDPFCDELRSAVARAPQLLAIGSRADSGAVNEAVSVVAFVTAWVNERNLEALQSSLDPQPIVAKAAPAAAPARLPKPKASMQHAVSLADAWKAPRRHGKPLPDHVGPPPEGHVLAVVINAGFPDGDGNLSRAGRRIALPRATAEAGARNGSLELVKDSPAAAGA